MTVTSKKNIGQLGEWLATQYLTDKGYSILYRNWRFGRLGEIDIVARDTCNNVLAFVEVKTRHQSRVISPLEAVSPAKQRQLIKLAEQFMVQHCDLDYEALRFDAIGIQLDAHNRLSTIDHILNAFVND